MLFRILLLSIMMPLMMFSEQFVVQRKKRKSNSALKEQLAECHAEIAQISNQIIQKAARLQQESHAELKNLSDGKSVDSLAQELEKAEKNLTRVKRCNQELSCSK